MKKQSGLTLVELIVVVAIASLMLGATIVFATPWIARESMRSSANQMVSFLQLAKIESVSRNRDCRFVVDTAARTMEIWDTWEPGDDSDDERLHREPLPTTVGFARPDSGDVVTLEQVGSTERYRATFSSDGMVNAGAGAVFLYGGQQYGAVEVHAAGGVEILYWDGSGWKAGS